MSRDGAASGDTWLIGDAAHAVLYSTAVFGVDSITLEPRNSATASVPMLGLIRRRSSGAARATMHWSLALSRLTGSASLASPGPPMVPSMLTRWAPDDPPAPPMRAGFIPYFAALALTKRTARCASSRGAGYRNVGVARWVMTKTVYPAWMSDGTYISTWLDSFSGAAAYPSGADQPLPGMKMMPKPFVCAG